MGASPFGITAGPDGAWWFTEYGSDKIGRMTTTGALTEYQLSAGASPEGIIADFGGLGLLRMARTRSERLAPTGVLAEYAIPTDGSQPQGVALGADGSVGLHRATGQ